jgi:hypothetical protein
VIDPQIPQINTDQVKARQHRMIEYRCRQGGQPADRPRAVITKFDTRIRETAEAMEDKQAGSNKPQAVKDDQ